MAKMESDIYKLRKCPECGKVFSCTQEWVYKAVNRGVKYYCSWTCYRKPVKRKKVLKP